MWRRLDAGQAPHPEHADGEERHDDEQHQLALHAGVGGHEAPVEDGQPQHDDDGEDDDDLGRAPGAGAGGADALAHVELGAGRVRQGAEELTQTGPAQAGVHDEGGDDEVRRGVVEVVGELSQRRRQGDAHAHAVRQQGQVLTEDRGGGVDGGGDGLLQTHGAGDGIPQRLGPGGQGLDLGGGELLLLGSAEEQRPDDDQQAGGDGQDDPAGEQQDTQADDEGGDEPAGQALEAVAQGARGAGAVGHHVDTHEEPDEEEEPSADKCAGEDGNSGGGLVHA